MAGGKHPSPFDDHAVRGYHVAGGAEHEISGLQPRRQHELEGELVNRTVVVRPGCPQIINPQIRRLPGTIVSAWTFTLRKTQVAVHNDPRREPSDR